MRILTLTLTWILIVSFSHCSFVYRGTGKVLNSYSQDHLVPYILSSSDLDAICVSGLALGPLVASFERVGTSIELTTMVAQLGAGICAEAKANEAELSYLIALRKGNAEASLDYQNIQIRQHGIAAKRFVDSYSRFNQYFGKWNGSCPEISEEEELYYLIGLSAGILALLHDISSQGSVGVSMEVPAITAAASKCLDPKKWWGVPSALEAMVWLSVPGATPEGKDAYRQLENSVKLGDQSGVRLARLFQLQAFSGKGDLSSTKKLLLDHSKSLREFPSRPEFLLLDVYAEALSRHESDKIWVKETGHRGPVRLGEFPGKKKDLKKDEELLKDL